LVPDQRVIKFAPLFRAKLKVPVFKKCALFKSVLPSIFPYFFTLSKWDFMKSFQFKFSQTRIPDLNTKKIAFALVSDRFQPAPYSEVPGSRPNSRVQIFPPEYRGVLGTLFVLSCSRTKTEWDGPKI
jgi:hypothetical protein